WMLFGSFTSVRGVRRTGLAVVRWEDFCFRPFTDALGDPTIQSWALTGPTNRPVSLEASTDLVVWHPVATNTLSSEGWRIFGSTEATQIFYRAKLLPKMPE